MKTKILFFSFLFLLTGVKALQGTHFVQDFDILAFYEVMKSGGVREINAEFSLVEAASIKEKDAYAGALLMKKAGLVKKPKDKLNLFKSGRIKFESAFRSDSNNVEYHFLRLTIQEHAPKIVKYNGQLKKDSEYIKKFFKNLSSTVQQVIFDYSKTSKVLHPEDFQL